MKRQAVNNVRSSNALPRESQRLLAQPELLRKFKLSMWRVVLLTLAWFGCMIAWGDSAKMVVHVLGALTAVSSLWIMLAAFRSLKKAARS